MDLDMHQEAELNLPHVSSTKVYVEAGGKWILHVWTDLLSIEREALDALEHGLDGIIGRETGYTAYVVHPKDFANADWT
jgi:hypothetical protein